MRDRLVEYYRWWRTWKTLPVKSWLDGARHYKQKEFALAAQCYLSGLEKFAFHPAAYSALLDYSHCLFKTGNFKDAQDGLRLAIARNSRRRDAYLRLARIQLWCGQLLDAAWTARRALQSIAVDSELLALFIIALVENGGPDYLLKEAEKAEGFLMSAERPHPLLDLAFLRLELFRQPCSDKFRNLEKMALAPGALFEAVLAYAEILLRKRRTIEARDQLRKVLQVVPNNPRVLSLLAESYLNDPSTSNPDYAVHCKRHRYLNSPQQRLRHDTTYVNNSTVGIAKLLRLPKRSSLPGGRSPFGRLPTMPPFGGLRRTRPAAAPYTS
jgi:Tfp pilus assembly protein PilF